MDIPIEKMIKEEEMPKKQKEAHIVSIFQKRQKDKCKNKLTINNKQTIWQNQKG